MSKLKLIIGTIILFTIVTGYTIYNDYIVNHCSPTGKIIENNIEPMEIEDIFTPAKGK